MTSVFVFPQLNIDSHGDEVNSPTDKDVDFFKQHEEETTPSDWSAAVPTTQPQSIPVSNGTVTKEQQLFGWWAFAESTRTNKLVRFLSEK